MINIYWRSQGAFIPLKLYSMVVTDTAVPETVLAKLVVNAMSVTCVYAPGTPVGLTERPASVSSTITNGMVGMS